LSVTVLTGCYRVFAMWRANFFMVNSASCDRDALVIGSAKS
jgi:hypothetical protein